MQKKLLAVAVAGALAAAARAVTAPIKRYMEHGIRQLGFPALVLNALIKTGEVAAGTSPMPVPNGSNVLAVRLEAALSANPAANDTVWLADLPEDCVPIDCLLDAPDLDTNGAPTITISAGFLNAAKTDLSSTWIAASNIGQAGGLARPTLNTMVREGASSARRSIGLKFPAAAATFAAGTIGLTVFYRAAHFGK